jgi:hypothetical protein
MEMSVNNIVKNVTNYIIGIIIVEIEIDKRIVIILMEDIAKYVTENC